MRLGWDCPARFDVLWATRQSVIDKYIAPIYISSIKKRPQFKDEDAERAFWAAHSPLDYFDTAQRKRATFPNLKPSLKSISIRLPQDMLDELKVLASKSDIPYQSLAKLYLSWGIHSERQRPKVTVRLIMGLTITLATMSQTFRPMPGLRTTAFWKRRRCLSRRSRYRRPSARQAHGERGTIVDRALWSKAGGWTRSCRS